MRIICNMYLIRILIIIMKFTEVKVEHGILTHFGVLHITLVLHELNCSTSPKFKDIKNNTIFKLTIS